MTGRCRHCGCENPLAEYVVSAAELRRLREERGVLAKTVARQIGVSPQALSCWEAGSRRPTPENYARWYLAVKVKR